MAEQPLVFAFEQENRREAPNGLSEAAESLAAERRAESAATEQLMKKSASGKTGSNGGQRSPSVASGPESGTCLCELTPV